MASIPRAALSIAVGVGLLALNWCWLQFFCYPFEIHTPQWQCEASLPLLVLSFVIPGVLFGWTSKRVPLLGSVVVALLIIAVGFITPLLDAWHGTDMVAAAEFFFVWGVAPTIVGASRVFLSASAIALLRPNCRIYAGKSNGHWQCGTSILYKKSPISQFVGDQPS